MRAVCLFAVLLFHAPFPWMGGGFLGVSTFFTLSGYLIGTLLLQEWRATGRVDLVAFWERRLRRLSPALWIGVLGVFATGPMWLDAATFDRLHADAAATLGYVSNWHFMAPEYAYSQLFSDPSPLQHSWSLSIEAQYYLVFPVLVVLLLRVGQLQSLVHFLLAASAFSAAVSLTSVADSEAMNRVYYGTLSRAAEPLAGAILAFCLPGWWTRETGRARWLSYAAPLLAFAMFALWSRSEVESAWLYRGGFALHALLSALLIAALLRPGPVQYLFSLEPLPWLGRLSYGAYVYHWPLFLLLSPERTGLGSAALFAVRASVTVGLAWLSLWAIEQRVRQRRLLAGRSTFLAAVVSVLIAVVATNHIQLPLWFYGISPSRVDDATWVLGRSPRVAGFGDSTAMVLAMSLQPYLKAAGVQPSRGDMQLGCPLMTMGRRYLVRGWARIGEKCRDPVARWRRIVEEDPIDIAFVLVGPWEIATRRFDGDDTIRGFGDPMFDRLFAQKIDETVGMFAIMGVGTIWFTSPPANYDWGSWENLSRWRETVDPARMERLNELLGEAATRWPQHLRVVDFAGFLREQGVDLGAEDVRADGVHFTLPAMGKLVREWLGPEVVRSINELVRGANERAPKGG